MVEVIDDVGAFQRMREDWTRLLQASAVDSPVPDLGVAVHLVDAPGRQPPALHPHRAIRW